MPSVRSASRAAAKAFSGYSRTQALMREGSPSWLGVPPLTRAILAWQAASSSRLSTPARRPRAAWTIPRSASSGVVAWQLVTGPPQLPRAVRRCRTRRSATHLHAGGAGRGVPPRCRQDRRPVLWSPSCRGQATDTPGRHRCRAAQAPSGPRGHRPRRRQCGQQETRIAAGVGVNFQDVRPHREVGDLMR